MSLFYKNIAKLRGCISSSLLNGLANSSLICPGSLDWWKQFRRSREKTLLKRGRDPPKFTAVISLIILRHNLFFTRGPRILISAVLDARKVAVRALALCLWRDQLTQPRTLPRSEWQQTEARAIRCRLGMKKCSGEMECLLVTFFNSSLKNAVIYSENKENCSSLVIVVAGW